MRLLETLERKKLVGTLVLGRKRRSLEVFLEENLLYLPNGGFLGKIDFEGLVESGLLGKKLSETAIETIALATDLTETLLPEVLYSRGLIDRKELEELAHRHLQEELFSRFLIYQDSFHFQEGNVPEAIIGQEGITIKVPILLDRFLEVVRNRVNQLNTIAEIIPTNEEIFVITEKGMARKQEALGDFGFQRIFDLLDGFRTLQSILHDGFFFPFYVTKRIVEALENGWIKKTLIPELRGVDPSQLSRDDAERYLPYFKSAVKYGVDEIKSRENLAIVLHRLNKADQAVIQYNFIGDTQYQMGRKAKAVQAYHQGLSIRPEDPLITEKIVRIYREGAEEAVRQGHLNEAITLYRNALQILPNNPEIFRALLNLHVAKKEISEIANLCDLITSRDRLSKDPGFAVEVVRSIIAQFPQEPLFYKKLINIYLDTGKTKEALDEMENLAQLFVKDGKTAQSLDLIEKILRLDPKRKHLRKLSKPPAKSRTLGLSGFLPKTFCVRIILVILLALFLYQFWAYRALEPARSQRYLAFASSDWKKPEEGTEIIESRLERRLRLLVLAAEDYQIHYPLSLFRWEAKRLESEFKNSAERLEEARLRLKEEILKTGLEQFRRGNSIEAEKNLCRLLACSEEDPARQNAETALAEIRGYEAKAAAVRQEAEKNGGGGNRPEAYRLFKKLMDEYPLSQAAKGLAFPVDLITIPGDAAVRTKNGGTRQSPCQFDFGPGSWEEVVIEKTGFEAVALRLTPSEGPIKVVTLRPEAAWQRELPPPGPQAPVFEKEALFYLAQNGQLHAINLQNGEKLWQHSLVSMISPVAAPLALRSLLLLPLNNGQILRFHPASGLEASFQFEGLITTSLLPGDDDRTIIFGSSRNQLVKFDFIENTVKKTMDLRDAPLFLTAGGGGIWFVLGASRTLFCVDFNAGKIHWKTPIKEKIASEPILLGPPGEEVLILRAEPAQLIALERDKGHIRWRRELSGKKPEFNILAMLPRSGRILFSEDGEALQEIEPVSGKELRRWQFNEVILPFEKVQELPRGLGMIRKDGSFVLADSATLLPLWGYQRDGVVIRSAAAAGEALILITKGGGVYCFKN
ncbi:MAG: PQQ-binding-like beta-propeller repeat protein [Planctomycetes bacterium]|nr:PQQ-binding-like beta-propeller repeat protein [Planctomycetota bacterium]